MSGGSVPYHLRQNKAVERGVFVDLLQRLSRATETNIREYQYIGFAGPFSEDFKLVHAHLGITRFTSIEENEEVLKRQQWNRPLSGIDYRCCTAREYIENYDGSTPSIIWLDYASPAQLASQLSEMEMLVSKCTNYDVLKVTFNANPTTLGSSNGSGQSLAYARIDEARQRLADYLPAGFDLTSDDIDKRGYPALILKAAEFAIKAGMQGKASSRFVPLGTFVYSDTHQMLTLTGIILPRGKITEFFRLTGIRKWPLAVTKWGADRTLPITITTPELSLRERLFVDQRLPRKISPKTIVKNLGFRLVDGVEEKTLQAIASYRDFYRYFPYFSKVVV